MNRLSKNDVAVHAITLPLVGARSYLFQTLLIAGAVFLPVAAHWTGLPVRAFLPMHWTVILAGLVYGWRGGALAGLLSPSASFIVSGMPMPMMIPAMTVELSCYGVLSGLLREHFRLNGFISVTIAIVVGRIAFVVTALLTNSFSTGLTEYLRIALLPGTIAALAQIIFLPLLAGWWIRQSSKE